MGPPAQKLIFCCLIHNYDTTFAYMQIIEKLNISVETLLQNQPKKLLFWQNLKATQSILNFNTGFWV